MEHFEVQMKELKEVIDEFIREIRKTIAAANPANLLMMLADLSLDGMHEARGDTLILHAHEGIDRPTEYVQSIIVSQPPCRNSEPAIDDTTPYGFQLMDDIKELLEKIQAYLLLLAKEKVLDVDFETLAFMVEAQFDFMVRGNRYQVFQREYYEPLLRPHDQELGKLYGVSSEELLVGLAKLEHALSQGRIEGMNSLMNFMDGRRDAKNPSDLTERERDTLKDIALEALGIAHYDVERITDWPIKLIRKLSYEPGEAKWFDQGNYQFWPIVTLPVHDRPFIRLDGHYYCFDYYTLMDNFYRAMQKAVLDDDPSYEKFWTDTQQKASESLVREVFCALLPGCKCLSNNYCGPRKSRFENDLVVLYADSIIIVEVKAGQFTAAPPLTDYEKHVRQYKALIEKAGSQCGRMMGYLNDHPDGAPVYDSWGNEKTNVSINGVAEIFCISVTVENVNTFASKADKLPFLELPDGLISISIDDLMVYKHFFESPLVFLHFLRQRKRASSNKKLMLDDELDHLGMYIHHNCYTMEADDIPEDGKLFVEGYRDDIDQYFSLLACGDVSIEKPKLAIPKTIAAVLDFLETNEVANRVDAAYFLLDLSTEGRDEFVSNVEMICSRQSKTGNQASISLCGDDGANATIYVSQPGLSHCYTQDEMKERTASLLFAHAERERALIWLEFDDDKKLVGYRFERFYPDDFDESQAGILKSKGDDYLRERVESYIRRHGKIGRNDLCPCGSGKKYKRCHGRSHD